MAVKGRKKHRYLLDWEKVAVVEAYKAGEKLSVLAEEFGIDQSTVPHLARRWGCPPRPTIRHK